MTDVPRFELARIARRLEIHAALARENRTTRQEHVEAMQHAARELLALATREEKQP